MKLMDVFQHILYITILIPHNINSIAIYIHYHDIVNHRNNSNSTVRIRVHNYVALEAGR